MFLIQALETTFLKASEAAAATLPREDKVVVTKGDEVVIEAYTPTSNKHLQVKLAEPRGKEDWYIYAPHWMGIANLELLIQQGVWLPQHPAPAEDIGSAIADPNEVNLPVPYHTQLNNRRAPHSTCNVTCVAMVCSYYGILGKTDEPQLEDEMDIWLAGKSLKRTWHENLVKLFAHYGVKDIFRTDWSWEAIKDQLRKGEPVITSGMFTQSGHIILLRGFSESKQCWYVNDPYGEWFSSGYRTDLTGENLEYSYGMVSRLSMAGANTAWGHFTNLM